MTVVEKILARACGPRRRPRGRRRRARRRPRDVARERGARAQPVPRRSSQGTGLEPRIWDPSRIAIIFDHRVPAESPKTATQPEEGPRLRGEARHHALPRHPRRRGRDLPPDPARERLRAGPGAVVVGTDSHTTSHGALERVRVRHRRHGDGLGLGARRGAQRRGAAHDQGRGERPLRADRRPEGPDPPPRRPAQAPRAPTSG